MRSGNARFVLNSIGFVCSICLPRFRFQEQGDTVALQVLLSFPRRHKPRSANLDSAAGCFLVPLIEQRPDQESSRKKRLKATIVGRKVLTAFPWKIDCSKKSRIARGLMLSAPYTRGFDRPALTALSVNASLTRPIGVNCNPRINSYDVSVPWRMHFDEFG
jgi:hypothetical protein